MDNAFKRRGWIVAALWSLLAVCSPVYAFEDKDAKDAAEPAVQLGPVTVPVIINGRVVNYLFLSVKVTLTSKVNESKMRDMEPYFRDAIIRLAYKTSFAQADHMDKLDEPRFKAAMLPEFSKITGNGGVKSIDVLSQNTQKHPH